MNTDWPRVRSLFDSLAGLPPSKRIERLQLLDNDVLAAELQDLLNNFDEAGSHFLATTIGFPPPVENTIPKAYAFHSGDVVGHRFVIVLPVGRGGMGEVYEAKDSKSGSRVALKCISTATNDGTDRLLRHEIEVARQITDPNVCRVHDVFEHEADSGAILLLSMEYIDGETLEQRLARNGRIPIAEAAPLVYQLLSGIKAAHRSGIIHRDLKPGNVLLARDLRGGCERLVITDFGIARHQQPNEGSTTLGGNIAGTFEYMAPEQLLGQSFPASDIYAAGLIIFEMLTSKKPFQGDPIQQALRRLIEPPPRLRSVASDVPLLWENVVERCLQRDPERRFQSAESVARALQGDSWAAGIPGMLSWSRRRWRVLTATGVLAIVAFALGTRALTSREDYARGVALSPVTTGGGLTMYSTISTDGTSIAYVSDRQSETNLQLWLQRTGDESSRRRITDDLFDASSPSFSRDGKRLVFRWERDGGGLYVADLPEGRPRLLVREGVEGRFSPDGLSIVYWAGEQAEHPITPGEIHIIPAAGGQKRRLAPDFAIASNPVFLPDGRHILFEGLRAGSLNYETSADWYVLDLVSGATYATGALDKLRSKGLRRYNRPGNFYGNRFLFSARSQSAANIYQLRLSFRDYTAQGDPDQLTFTTALMDSPATADNGLMAVTNSAGALNVWELPLKGNGPDRRITTSLYYDTHPTVSADGLSVAFGRSLGREREIWLRTPEGERVLVPSNQEEKYWPVIRADGSEVAYSAIRGSKSSISVVGTKDGNVRKVCDGCGDPLHFSNDGNSLLTFQGSPSRLAILDRKSGQSRVVVQSSNDLAEGQFSPDDRFIAFRENTGDGHSRIWIAPADSRSPVPPARWMPVTSDTEWNDKPHWSDDGGRLFFLSNRDGFLCIWEKRLGGGSSLQPVRHFHAHTFSPSEASRMAFNFTIARGNIVTNPAVVHGNVWVGRLFGGK